MSPDASCSSSYALLVGCVDWHAHVHPRVPCRSLRALWSEGYSALDIVQTVFRVARTMDLDEPLLLDIFKEIGFTQMRIADGLTTILQLQGMCSRIYQRSLAHGMAKA